MDLLVVFFFSFKTQSSFEQKPISTDGLVEDNRARVESNEVENR